VDIAPPTGHLDVGLVYPPAVPDTVSARACRLCQQRREALHPAEDADVVDSDPAFGQQLFHVPIGEPVPEVPPDRHQDHLRREPETGEARP